MLTRLHSIYNIGPSFPVHSSFHEIRGLMHTHLAVVAEFASEGEDAKLTIAGIFDEVYAIQTPCTLPRMYIVAELHARVVEGSEHALQITMIDADGKDVVKPSRLLPLFFSPGAPGSPLKARIIASMDGVGFPKEGDYEVVLWVDGNHLISLPLHVSLMLQRS
jgi:hypothetical protein